MKQAILLVTLAALFITQTASAQMARMYTSASGLENSQIYCIYQDNRGFIWIGTENGLSRFDGMSFSTFRFDRNRPNSIASSLVLDFFQDSRGTYWTGTSSGLQILDQEYSTFTKVDLKDPGLPESDPHISSIIEASSNGSGKIIAASSGHGIYVIDIETHEIDIELQEAINKAVISPFVYKLFKDSQNRLWMASEEGGISIISLDDLTVYDNIWAGDLKAGKDSVQGHDFEEIQQTGDILIATATHGILIYDYSEGKIRRSKNSSQEQHLVMSILPNRIAQEYGDNTFIIGLENNGLRLFDYHTESIREIFLPNVSFNTSGWKVHELMEDSQGNVWVGAYQTGIMVVPKSMFGFEYKSFSRDMGNTDDGVCVTSITADSDGIQWIGTDGGGLFSIDKDGNVRNFSTSSSSLSNNSIMSLETDKRGRLWIATYLGGLITYTEKEGFRRFRDHKAINTDKVVSLEYCIEEDIIYAGTHGSGFAVIDAAEEKVTRTWADDDYKWISALHIDNTGILWVGTYNGPMTYDNKTRTLKKLDIHEGLATRAHSFCLDKNGRMWIGTGEGLVCFDQSLQSTVSYSKADGLPSNSVTDILESNDGNLWMSTLNGLSVFNPETKEFRNYYHYDGLQENEFHSGAAFKGKDGKLSFGGIKGLTSFYPHIVDQQSHQVPPIYLSALNVMNEAIEYDPQLGKDNILDKHITEATTITLPADAKVFSMEFSVLEYTNPQKIVYAYQMEGFDKEWKYAGQNSRILTYTNLPNGKYLMKIKAFFDGEPETFSYREIGIRILPPWYKTIWAWGIYLLIVVCGVFGVRSLIKRHKDLKNDKEISAIREMKLQMFTNISHEIRTPLTLVMNPLKTMREGESDPRQKDLYNLMYRNCLRILRLVNQLMDMRKIDNGQMQLHFLKTDVVYFIKDIMQSFENLAVTRKINFTLTKTSDVVDLWVDQGNFDKIIFNLLSNAFKYTPDNGEIRIKVSGFRSNEGILECKAKEYVEFVVSNSGSSIEERNLEKVFERFFQEDVKDAKVGSGVGLHLTKMLVKLHHGDIRAYNTEDGMAFAVRLPVGNSHLSQEEMTKPTNHKDLYTKSPTDGKEHAESREDVTFAPNEKESGRQKQTKSKRNIVLVDDDSEMRMYLKQELQSTYNIEVCSGGKEAWTKITTTRPDAVVTDLMMDGMDGAELCEKIKKNPETNHIPVIILTSSGDEVSQQRCIDSGADRFFTKPISLEILKSAIASAISTRVTIRNKYNREIDYKYSEMEMPDSSKRLVTKVIATIRENLENPEFSVEDLSHEVGMSRVHLNRKLKEIMNISPSNLIKSIRLKQAAFLLINNKVNISEVAYKVGFSTHSYFSNSFHDYFGLTPSEFVAKYMDCKDEETLNRIFH